MKKIALYLVAILLFVGCESSDLTTDNYSPDNPEQKPVRPIKPRPIVPEDQIQRPRVIDMPTMVIVIDVDELRGLFSTPGPFAVRARSEISGKEYATTWEGGDANLEIAVDDIHDVYVVTLDNGVEEYSFAYSCPAAE